VGDPLERQLARRMQGEVIMMLRKLQFGHLALVLALKMVGLVGWGGGVVISPTMHVACRCGCWPDLGAVQGGGGGEYTSNSASSQHRISHIPSFMQTHASRRHEGEHSMKRSFSVLCPPLIWGKGIDGLLRAPTLRSGEVGRKMAVHMVATSRKSITLHLG
jgi:hypothetical protein